MNQIVGGQNVITSGQNVTFTVPVSGTTTYTWSWVPYPVPTQEELDLNDMQKKIDAYDRAMGSVG